MREQVLVNITRPYQKVTLSFLAQVKHEDRSSILLGPRSAHLRFLISIQELNLSREEVERLLVDMILEERLIGQIDQIAGYVKLGGER